jgi:leucyl aminopeptidase
MIQTFDPIILFHDIAPSFPDVTGRAAIPIRFLRAADYEEYYQRASASQSRQMEQAGFTAKARQCCTLLDDQARVAEILFGMGEAKECTLYDAAALSDKIKLEFSSDFLGDVIFTPQDITTKAGAEAIAAGWALANYKFNFFKKDASPASTPALAWPALAERKSVAALVESLCLIKTLINLPANILGTEELSQAAAEVARRGRASFSVISDAALLDQNFPMIYAVGNGSPRRPKLIELKWGDSDHPLITLVGKGVVFDTGGLDLKPPPFMLTMKKDMGGAAHVLALAHYIMAMGWPVALRVLIPSAENSVDGASFRPGDIIQSRKGLSVEIGDTDAEGRLVVGDAITYACEGKKPEMIVDFCTLTGSARAALGYDIPAFFTNRAEIEGALKQAGAHAGDPVWPLPLYQPYLKEMNSAVADLNNVGSGKAGAIHGALFIQQFIDPAVDWVHVDCYAWEQSGKPGRPAGGADTGLRAMLLYLEQRFVKN